MKKRNSETATFFLVSCSHATSRPMVVEPFCTRNGAPLYQAIDHRLKVTEGAHLLQSCIFNMFQVEGLK